MVIAADMICDQAILVIEPEMVRCALQRDSGGGISGRNGIPVTVNLHAE
jgi:hypothetical protein